jgi:hypothetical protein
VTEHSIPDSLHAELRQLGGLESLGNALAGFVRALDPKGTFKKERQQWVNRPDNFVTFSIHHKRTRNIVLSLRGHTAHYKEPSERAGLYDEWLRKLDHGMREYSMYRITSAAQLLAAAYFIQVAFDYPSRGRKRSS